MPEKFQVTVYDGKLAVVKQNGKDIDYHQTTNLINILQDTYNILHGDKSASRLIGIELATQAIRESSFIYGNETLPYMQRIKSKGCVYFITHPNYPSLVKIGTTKNLKNRMAQIAQDNYGINPQVLAFIKTKSPVSLEMYLHMAFDKHRRIGEWFDEHIVIDFIERLNMGEISFPP